MAEEIKLTPRCELDTHGCANLSSIIQSFNAPISEEQAWAVCYQTAKCMWSEWEQENSCYILSDTSQIRIHKDGTVHSASVRANGQETRTLATTEYKLVTSLGVTIFYALDYGLCEDEERKLSSPLELLIDRMTSADSEGDTEHSFSSDDDAESQNADEGIERDSGEDSESDLGKEKNGLTLLKVMEMCESHSSCPTQADVHFKAVCRALVAEALELSTFLDKISDGTQDLIKEAQNESGLALEKLKFQDWARLWVQVIQELRHGVKLKKVDPDPHPVEFELTPYEMLLDDIRSRRYKLNKVMVNGDIPQRVKKDAHALILEFIRSRPPLIPVNKRKMPPTPPRQLNLYEKLMASIKQQHKLKPVGTKDSGAVETSRTKLEECDDTPQPHRRLIKADLRLRLSSSFEDDDLEDLTTSQENLEEPTFVPIKAPLRPAVDSERRHSISVCESPPKPQEKKPSKKVKKKTPRLKSPPESIIISSQTASDYWISSQWRSLECLSLTLEEVSHIRKVLTTAELETLVVTQSQYHDIRKGKVCFSCTKTRFSFFGSWGVKCKICERTVCEKCSTKIYAPTDDFCNIPVYMVSPVPSPLPEKEKDESSSQTFWKLPEAFQFSSSKATSSPEEPTVKEKRHRFRHSESVHLITENENKQSSMKRAPLMRSKTIHHESEIPPENEQSPEEKVQRPMMKVCKDCENMVFQIIDSSCDDVAPYEKRRNGKKWSQQRAMSCAVAASAMSPVDERSSPIEASPRKLKPQLSVS